MLTARAAFARDTLTDTLAALVQSDPDWSALPTATPARIRDLLRHCLQKDPQRRLRDIGDARLEIDDAIAAPKDASIDSTAAGQRSTSVVWFVAGLIVASTITAAMLLLGRRQPDVAATDLTLTIAPPSASGIQPWSPYCPDPRSPRMVPWSRTTIGRGRCNCGG